MNYLWTNIALGLTEQVDQRQTWTREDLDQMSCVYICPTSLARDLVPAYGSQHSEFTGMTVLTAGVERMAAGLSRITVNYVGKINISGSTVFISDIRTDSNWTEGEVSYTQTGISSYIIPGIGEIFNAERISVSQRYTAKGCTIKYVTNQRPTEGLFMRAALPYLGFSNIVIVHTGVEIIASGTALASGLPPGQRPPTQSMALVDLDVKDRFGWYEVVETYASKMFPGSF